MSSRPVPATAETHGPFRKVVGTVTRFEQERVGDLELGPNGRPKWHYVENPGRPYEVEVLECGHPGSRVGRWGSVASKRRCGSCRHEAKVEAEARRPAEDAAAAAALRAELASPAGQAAEAEARRRRANFTVHHGL